MTSLLLLPKYGAPVKSVEMLENKDFDRDRLKQLYDLGSIFLKFADRKFPKWRQKVKPTDQIVSQDPISSFYNLLEMRTRKPFSERLTPTSMSTEDAEFMAGMFGDVSTLDDKEAFAAILTELVSSTCRLGRKHR